MMYGGSSFSKEVAYVSNEFAPFVKLAEKIDGAISMLSFNKMMGNMAEVAKNEAQIRELRKEVAKKKAKFTF